jgi:hypothetical protein
MRRVATTCVLTAMLISTLLGSTAGTAAAIPLEVQGTTSGSFFAGPVDLGSSIPLLGLAFSGADFGPTTSTTLNLGTFTLNSLLGLFNPFDFVLDVDFLVPPDAGGTSLFADLLGAVIPVFGGGAKIDFANNGPIHFTYDGGSFDLSVADVAVKNGTSGSIVGTISNVVLDTPIAVVAPGTLMLVLAGLGLVSAVARARR